MLQTIWERIVLVQKENGLGYLEIVLVENSFENLHGLSMVRESQVNYKKVRVQKNHYWKHMLVLELRYIMELAYHIILVISWCEVVKNKHV